LSRVALPRRLIVFITLAIVLAGVFVRLGFWQLDRLAQRRARNAQTRARLVLPAMPFAAVVATRDNLDRRTSVDGVPDYEREFVVTGRSRDGSPGVHIVTPLKVTGDDSVVLVNRGWVYAPDAETVDLSRWREARRVFTGYTRAIPEGASLMAARTRGVRQLATGGVSRLLPYPFHTLYVVSQDSSAQSTLVRLPPPALDEGPHLSYAIQWFSFAIIALVGAAAVGVRARVSPEGRQTGQRPE